ncbi:7145_t:CDS:2 [Rhizophagus irregularis]|nr:7145_t:CDS:2 [Rhizophagus irregularis]
MSAFIAFISDTTCTEESIESIENDYSLVLGQSGIERKRLHIY